MSAQWNFQELLINSCTLASKVLFWPIFYNPAFELGETQTPSHVTTRKTTALPIKLSMSSIAGFMAVSYQFVCVSVRIDFTKNRSMWTIAHLAFN